MPPPLRAAILGTGHGHALGKLRVLESSPDWELTGVCEPDPALRAQREHEPAWAGVRWLDEAAVLEDATIRMVAVESEVPQLVPLGRRAVAAGKHLHLDKPAGSDLEAFRALLADARRQGLVVQMGYMFRYNDGFDRVRQAVREGWLGRIHALRGGISTDLGPEARRRVAFHPGGMMLELGCHLIDMLVLLMGPPRQVHSFLRRDGALADGLADNTLAVFEYPHATATIESAAMEFQAFPRRRFEVCGDQGSILLEPLEPPALRLCLRAPRPGFAAGWQEVPVRNWPRYERDLAELARCIHAGEPLPYSYDHDLAVQEVVLAASMPASGQPLG
jgi:predicted dehydrogenase